MKKIQVNLNFFKITPKTSKYVEFLLHFDNFSHFFSFKNAALTALIKNTIDYLKILQDKIQSTYRKLSLEIRGHSIHFFLSNVVQSLLFCRIFLGEFCLLYVNRLSCLDIKSCTKLIPALIVMSGTCTPMVYEIKWSKIIFLYYIGTTVIPPISVEKNVMLYQTSPTVHDDRFGTLQSVPRRAQALTLHNIEPPLGVIPEQGASPI